MKKRRRRRRKTKDFVDFKSACTIMHLLTYLRNNYRIRMMSCDQFAPTLECIHSLLNCKCNLISLYVKDWKNEMKLEQNRSQEED